MFGIGLFSEEPVNCPSGALVPKLRAPFEDKRKLNGMVLLLFNDLFFHNQTQGNGYSESRTKCVEIVQFTWNLDLFSYLKK